LADTLKPLPGYLGIFAEITRDSLPGYLGTFARITQEFYQDTFKPLSGCLGAFARIHSFVGKLGYLFWIPRTFLRNSGGYSVRYPVLCGIFASIFSLQGHLGSSVGIPHQLYGSLWNLANATDDILLYFSEEMLDRNSGNYTIKSYVLL
jgi:hypothetical protein